MSIKEKITEVVNELESQGNTLFEKDEAMMKKVVSIIFVAIASIIIIKNYKKFYQKIKELL